MDQRSIAKDKEALTDGGLSKLDKCRSTKLRLSLLMGCQEPGFLYVRSSGEASGRDHMRMKTRLQVFFKRCNLFLSGPVEYQFFVIL
jgi:hypothetical protein